VTGLLASPTQAKALWYLTRGTGAVALLLLTVSVVLGVVSTTRFSSQRWPRFVVSGLHRNSTLLALVFVLIHIVTTILDGFAPIGYTDAVVPLRSPYRTVWLGLGAVAFDLLLALIITSLLRARIGIRLWRATHWLAYASWPIALVHSLGTGSDTSAAWLQLLAAACGIIVILAVVARAALADRGRMRVRVAAVSATALVPLAIVIWARSGPLQAGWAARAGTPARLLASRRTVTASVATRLHKRVPTRITARRATAVLPRGAFRAQLAGSLTQSSVGNGLVVLQIDATASGGFAGRVHVALRGLPLAGGGVQMEASVVGILPAGAQAWYAGQVVGLAGQQVLALVRAPGGQPVRVVLALQIAQSGAVSGLLEGGAAATSGFPGVTG
jgi:Ferric reductase like transmembrane component